MNKANINVVPKPGQRIECVAMPCDPSPIDTGSRGTVLGLNKLHSFNEFHVHVAWDSGRTLNLVSSVDSWKVLTRE